MKVILDSSFLIQCIEKKADLSNFVFEEQVHLITTESIVNELKELSAEKNKKGINASLALLLLQSNKVEAYKTQEEHDNSVIELAVKEKAGIATADDGLSRRARRLNLKVYYVKEGGKIV